MDNSKNFFAWFSSMAALAMAVASRLPYDEVKMNGAWEDAHATFYGDMSGGETMRKRVSIILFLLE